MKFYIILLFLIMCYFFKDVIKKNWFVILDIKVIYIYLFFY